MERVLRESKKFTPKRIHDYYGYIIIKNRSHRSTDKNGYVREHRIVWEEHHKASLLSWADVHHINGIRDHNKIENLQAMTSRQHHVHHSTGKHYRKDMSDRCCCYCHSIRTRVSKSYSRWSIFGTGWLCYRCDRRFNRILKRLVVG